MKKIIYQTPTGVAIVHPTGDLSIEEIAQKDVPPGVTFDIIDTTSLPADRIFRDAWEKSGSTVVESLLKAKLISHDKRRAKRAEELAPLDVKATIPSQAAAAEAARQAIRDKYAAMQTKIDACVTPEQLKSIISGL